MGKEIKDDTVVFGEPITFQKKTYQIGDPVPAALADDKNLKRAFTTYDKVRPLIIQLSLAEENKQLKAKIKDLEAMIKKQGDKK